MSASDVNTATKITILKHLIHGRSLDFTAAAVSLRRDQVIDVAADHGYPEAGRMEWAVDVLTKRLDQIPPGTPTRAPSPAPPSQQPVPTSPPPLPRPGNRQLVKMLVTDLHPDPNNPRDNDGDVAELAESMRAVGLLQPIVARRHGNQVVVVAGHRRLAAAKHLAWSTVDVIVRDDMRPDAVLAAMLIENGQRTDLDPIEEARALNRLHTQSGGGSHQALAKRIGRTQVHVSGRLALLALPVEQQELLRAGQLNLGDAVRKARVASGRGRPPGYTGSSHLGVDHDLAKLARARCTRLGHRSKGRNSVGGVACGDCWESVIRADERQHLHTRSATTGRCALCETPIRDATAVAG